MGRQGKCRSPFARAGPHHAGAGPAPPWNERPLQFPLDLAIAETARVPLLGTTATVAGITSGLPGSPDVTYWPARPSVILEIDTDGIGEYGRLRHRPRGRRVRDDLALDALPLVDEPARESSTGGQRELGEESIENRR